MTTTQRSSASSPPPSPAKSIALDAKRRRLVEGLTSKEKTELWFHWPFWARENQLAPKGEWRTWLLMSGRGFGKTRAGAEWFRSCAESLPNSRGLLIANTPGDARDVMIQGPSGIMSVCPPWNRPEYEPSNLTLKWSNGFTAAIRSANNPEVIRGVEQEIVWADELAAWPAKKARIAWDNAMFGFRIGKPQACVTTTPKPLPLLLEIHDADNTVVTTGSTYENEDNLAPEFIEQVLSKYEGTSLGRQEIYAEILSEVEGALWTRAVIEASRVTDYPDLTRIVTGVDPPGGATECGIVTGALGADGHLYFLSDASLQASPGGWGEAVVNEFLEQEADLVVGETNYGGDMVQHTIETAAKAMNVGIRYANVRASRGKAVRAHPVAALFEQNRAHIVGSLPQLEGEMTMWKEGEPSPNRMDAMVWVAHELMPIGYRATDEIGI